MQLVSLIYLTFCLMFNTNNNVKIDNTPDDKMEVEIWSDVVCPFCYIGKRKFEKALSDFKYKDNILVRWRSYQLDPDADTHSGETAYAYLARVKGQSLDWSVQMHRNVTEMAASVGLDYHFEKSVMSNSYKAHKLIQFARMNGLDAEVEEQLFKAYFTNGQNIGSNETLVELAVKAGLNPSKANEAITTEKYAADVQRDIQVGAKYGLTGVPFFVFDGKYSVSGAQDPSVFLKALEKAYEEFSATKSQNNKK
jgi:predicted DsbA family dithiol-disulfide isomerase